MLPAGKFTWLLCVISTGLLHLAVRAQTQTEVCSGKMVDYDSGLPIVGLRVCALAGSPCTLTDADGFFSLPVPLGTDSLLFTGLGYTHRDEALTSKTHTVTIGLTQDPFELMGCTVTGHLTSSSNASSTGSFGLIKRPVLSAGDEWSLQYALNTIPGVTLESRGYGGSQRLQIRGSFLRAPFAVRNIRMYLHGIPFSSPDGTAPLEMVDAADVHTMEVVKGPAGSSFGSGTGGALLLHVREAPKSGTSIAHGQTYGDFGIRRYYISAESGSPKSGFRFSHVYQENDGYRRQEFNRKHQLSFTARYRLSEKVRLFAYATWYNGHWALPGALSAGDSKVDPTSANAFSAQNNASLYRERLWTGGSMSWSITPSSSLVVSAYATTTAKQNPYGTSPFFNGYKDEGASGGGGRLSWKWHRSLTPNWKCGVESGAEIQLEKFSLHEYANDGGLPGSHQFSYLTDYTSGMLFSAVNLEWKNRFRLEAGISGSQTIHAITAYRADWLRADTTASWGLSLLPRAGLAYRVDSLIWMNASVSYGNSNPVIFEQIDPSVFQSGPEHFVKSRLQPERGVNYEVGLKGEEHHSHVEFELAAYLFLLSDIIIPVTDSGFVNEDEGMKEFTRYINAGGTRQQGLELSFRKTLIQQPGWLIQRVDAQVMCTRNVYRFADYMLDGQSWKDRYIPGLALHTFSASVFLRAWKDRLGLSIQHFWFDRMPLNNDNSRWLSAWSLVNARVDAALWVSEERHWSLHVHGGINNATGSSYTSFPNLNDTRGRYYNPAPPRNFFGGFQIRFRLD